MTKTAGPDRACDESQTYEIRLQGHLDARWADRLEGLTFTHESTSTTTLTGPLADQAALHGLLARLRDLGLPILSLRRICAAGQPTTEEQPQ